MHHSSSVPKTGLEGLKENWRADLLSGFLVFLIALPLCLGIASASGFPTMSGIITAVIGGIVVSRLSGSFVTINGPAAGLIVVILSAVQSLGQTAAMGAIVVASVFQILMGVMKAGRLNAYFPSSVVHGMLAAIGIIIMAKQIHVMLGVKPESKEILGVIAEIPSSLMHLNPSIALIGFVGLLILILWSKIKNPHLKMVPAPLVVVGVGMILAKFFDIQTEHAYSVSLLSGKEFTIGPKFLVSVPENVSSYFYTPDFSKIGTREFWGAVISICLVGSLETLLSATAVDKLDPYKRYSDLNKDLTAVGIGNLVASAIGGLPMIAEIVRSSANVSNGAKTGWSNFFHGLFLAFFVLAFPWLIREIPFASLAALLVFTGFRLSSPKEFAKTMDLGHEQLILFVITIIGVLATDLLVGVLIGILAKIIIHLAWGVKLSNLIRISFEIEESSPESYLIRIHGSAIFSNFIGLKSVVSEIPAGKKVTFDVSDAYLIDHTVMEFIDHFRHDYQDRGGDCEILGLERLKSHAKNPLGTHRFMG